MSEVATPPASVHAIPPGATGRRKAFLRCEWLMLYGLAPTLVALRALPPVALWGIPILLMAMMVDLARDKNFDNRQFWGVQGLRDHLGMILLRFILLSSALGLLVLLFHPHRLFAFPRHAPQSWAVVMVLYPIVSVYPQEIVYRAYYFHRYAALFPKRGAMLISNALAFSYAHLLFWNPFAIILTFFGGLYFAHTYDRSRSMLAVCVEHGLYGCFIFTIGLGEFFYHGAAR